MPDRIIRESICTSDTLNQLTDFEERFWHRLTVNCDDYGRFDARPAILKGRLFPLAEGKTQKNMTDALNKLASVGLVELYEVDGRPFLHVVTWDKYQRIRAKRSKYPSPDNACRQMPSNVPVIQSNPNPYPNPNPNESAEPYPVSTPVFTLQLNTGSEYEIFQSDVNFWKELYPSVDVMQELRNMRGWLDVNPKKRKTSSGIKRFINGWLSREQDSPKRDGKNNRGLPVSPGAPPSPTAAKDDIARMERYLEKLRKDDRYEEKNE